MQGKIVYTLSMPKTTLFKTIDISIRQLGRHRFMLYNSHTRVHPVAIYRSLAHAHKVLTAIFLATASWKDSSLQGRKVLRQVVVNILKNTQE